MATVFFRVKRIVVEKLGVEESAVVPTASFTEDLGADSLDLVEFIMSLEDEFSKGGKKLTIPDEDAKNIRTVQEVVDYLKEHGIEDEP